MTASATSAGYLDLPPEQRDYATARIAVLPCPFDGTSTYGKGADRGPAKLIEASGQVEFFDLELRRKVCERGIVTLPAVEFVDDDPAKAVAAIEAAALPAVRDGKFLLGLGGEHSVSIGLTRAVRAVHGRFSLLHVDAHADLRAEWHGSPYNHACAIHAIAEDDRKATIVSIGIRAVGEDELVYAKERGVHLFPGHTLRHRKEWIREAVALLEDPVYVTIDLDGLDPTVMPSTGTPVPGGLDWWQVVDLVKEIGAKKRVIACDVNELKPDGVNHHSEFLAAQLSYKMLNCFVDPPRKASARPARKPAAKRSAAWRPAKQPAEKRSRKPVAR